MYWIGVFVVGDSPHTFRGFKWTLANTLLAVLWAA